MKKLFVVGVAVLAAVGLAGCSAAETTSYNISKDSDNFKVERRIVFINGITDNYLFSIEGRCSIQPDVAEGQLEVTCKTGENSYKKHFLGLTDNIGYLVEQLEPSDVDEFHYKVVFRPESIVPDFDLQTSND